MGKPKKQSSARQTGLRRSHLLLELARKVNSKLSNIGSSVKVKTTKREGTGKPKKVAEVEVKAATKTTKAKKAA